MRWIREWFGKLVSGKAEAPSALMCRRCSHEWKQRGDNPPKWCPSCHNDWRRQPRTGYQAECSFCGHKWVAVTEMQPKSCPRCRNPYGKSRQRNAFKRKATDQMMLE
jgi:hypothetical protein